MTPEQQEALAEFLTQRAAHYSVCLQLGGMHAIGARAYFTLRDKFGINGWETKEEVLARWRAKDAY